MINNRQKGVSLVITFFTVTIILSVVLTIVANLYSETKITRNAGNLITSYYAAESGIEKVSYYDRKIIPIGVPSGTSRGVCYMCDPINPSCPDCTNCSRSGTNCDSDDCTNCTVTFSTDLIGSGGNKESYDIKAVVLPNEENLELTIEATGSYKDAQRAIQMVSIEEGGSGGGDGGGDDWTCGDNLTDSRNDKIYSTVLIGGQCWMRQNINIGTMIKGKQTQRSDCSPEEKKEKYCYDDNEANCDIYGGLYTFDQATCGSATPGTQGICPTGWHVPTHDEFTTLERAVCTSGTCATDFPYDTSTQGWRGTNEGTTLKTVNSSSFSAPLSGYRNTDGSFINPHFTAFWSSVQSSGYPWHRFLRSSSATVARTTNDKANGFSVRCLKDGAGAVNTAPNEPTLVFPINGSTTSDNTPTLSVNYSDPDAGDTGTTNYRIATSVSNCLAGTVVVSGTSSETASNNQSTTWTPVSSIGSDATYYWCAQNNDGVAQSVWISMGNFILNTAVYTITYTAGVYGSITGTSPQTVNYGANGTFVTAVPDPGYYFINWSDGVLTASRIDTNVTANISVTANFIGAWASCGDTLIDSRDNKTYSTVLIGNQCWTRQNMNIGTMTIGTNNQGADCPSASAIEKYCYDNNEANCDTYGGLYQGAQAMCGSTTPGTQGICPTGWHIPTHDEFTTLERAVCTSGTCATDFPYDTSTLYYRGTNEGISLKTIDSTHFSALPAGWRVTPYGYFNNIGYAGYFWASGRDFYGTYWFRSLDGLNNMVWRSKSHSPSGFSVRCLKD